MINLKSNNNLSISKIISLIWFSIDNKRRYQVFFLLIIILICGISEVLNLVLLKNFLTILNTQQEFDNNLLIFKIIDFLNLNNKNLLALSTFIFIFSSIFTAAFRLLNLWLNGVLSGRITSDISYKVFLNSINREYKDYVQDNSSNVVNKLSLSINGLVNVLGYIFNLFSSVIIIAIIFIGLCYINYSISLLSIFLFGLTYYFLLNKSKKFLSKNSVFILRNGEKQLKLIQEVHGAFREIIINANQQFFLKKYKNIDYPMRYKLAQNRFISSSPKFILENIGFIFLATLALVLSSKSQNMIPLLGIFALAAQKILPSMHLIFQSLTGIRSNSAYISDIFESFHKNNQAARNFTGDKNKITFKDSIEIRNLSFRYTKGKPYTLKNINFHIRKGDHLGIIGKTGCGKSTLIDILMGLIKPNKGNIFIDGVKLFDNQSASKVNCWWTKISHVPQHIFLIDGSILENIVLGIDNDKINMEKIFEVIKKAKIDEFINDLENGIHTKIGERGILLSGGQIQRIGIARALYKDSELIIFDEATSALDIRTEKSLVHSLNNLRKDITVITITHRLSTIKDCDKIIEINNGEIFPVKT